MVGSRLMEELDFPGGLDQGSGVELVRVGWTGKALTLFPSNSHHEPPGPWSCRCVLGSAISVSYRYRGLVPPSCIQDHVPLLASPNLSVSCLSSFHLFFISTLPSLCRVRACAVTQGPVLRKGPHCFIFSCHHLEMVIKF